MSENINNASHNAIEKIKLSYALQDIARDSHYTISEVKEIHRAVKTLEKVKEVIKAAEETGVNIYKVVQILKDK